VGEYRPEHLFTLKQSLEGYRYYQKLILELDRETARFMQALPSATQQPMPPCTKATAYTGKATILSSIFGVSCTALPESISPTFPK
jgi:hypothetical protein